MNDLACSSLKDLMVAYLTAQTSVHESDGDCIITVPINTVDNRWVDVTVESSGSGFYIVHDAGKSSDELFLQGVSPSPKKNDVLRLIAQRYGVEVSDGRFLVGCNADLLQHSIMAVAHSSGMAMGELLRHKPNIEDEAVRSAVGGIIVNYGMSHGIRVARDISVQGQTTQHTFDFIAQRADTTVAVNVLIPSSYSLGRAKQYGFQVLDTRDTYRTYRRMAILAHPGMWSAEATSIVTKVATQVIDFANPNASSSAIVESLDRLLEAA